MTINNEPLRDVHNKSFKVKFKAIYELVRPELSLAGGMCIIASQIIVLHSLPTFFVGVMGFLTGFFISGAALISNDYFDLDVDRVNHPQRPLPSGRISIMELMILTGLFTVAGFITAGLLGPVTLGFAVFIWIIAISYNWRFKESGLLGNIMVGISVAWFFIFGGATVDGLTNGLIWIFAGLAFIFDVGEEIAGDAMDMVGDEERTSKTLARLYGKPYALRVSSALFILFTIVSLIPFLIGWLSIIYLVIFLPIDLVVLYLAMKLLKSQTVEEGRRIIRQLYLTLTIFIIVFVISSIL
ncbi:MAG: UbiA family prenyltransferase [Methanobacterium sp.]|jgi:geranylgeranylglycerol-phosphate geranylgeranyltransferase